MYIKNKKGQSTVEYVLLVSAVVLVIILFVTSNKKGSFQDQMNQTLNTTTQEIGTLSDRLASSHGASPAPTDTTPPYSVKVTP